MRKLKKLFPLRALPKKISNRVRQSYLTQKALTPFGEVPHPQRWIFIIGCYNSGTTLLQRILSNHPEIGGLDMEGVFLTDSLPSPEEYGWTRLWYKCLDEMRLEPIDGMEERSNRIKKQWSIWFPDNKPNLVEKSVANTAQMPFLEAYFRPAYFIYIIRNGYAAAGGIREKADFVRWNNPEYDDEYPIELCAKQWAVSDKVVQEDRKKVDRFLQIYYKDLAENTEEALDRITDFLGISNFSKDQLQGKWRIHEKNAEIKNMNQKSFRRLTPEDVRKIRKVAGDTLKKHGYEPPDDRYLNSES